MSLVNTNKTYRQITGDPYAKNDMQSSSSSSLSDSRDGMSHNRTENVGNDDIARHLNDTLVNPLLKSFQDSGPINTSSGVDSSLRSGSNKKRYRDHQPPIAPSRPIKKTRTNPNKLYTPDSQLKSVSMSRSNKKETIGLIKAIHWHAYVMAKTSGNDELAKQCNSKYMQADLKFK